jgi:hypothetical protein
MVDTLKLATSFAVRFGRDVRNERQASWNGGAAATNLWRNSSLPVVIANQGSGDVQGLDDFGRDHFAFWLKICLDVLLQW